MKKIKMILPAVVLSAGMVFGPVPVYAAATEGSTFISLGADLSEEQKQQVLDTFGVSESDLSNDTVVTVTNQEEHDVLGSYVSEAELGDFSLSSTMVTVKGDGYGIHVATQNINYCTPEMYENALATAGIKNADVIVTSPVEVSGTAGLVGAMKAYSALTGEALDAQNVDTAADELVATGVIGDSIGDKDKAAEAIAAIKAQAVKYADEIKNDSGSSSSSSSSSGSSSSGTSSGSQANASSASGLNDEKIDEIISDTEKEFNITFSDSDKALIRELIRKYVDLNLDSSTLEEQAASVYQKLKDAGIDVDRLGSDTQNVLQKIGTFFQNIASWFSGLFGNKQGQ